MLDDNGMIKSEMDMNFCLQAGYGSGKMVGRVLRVQHCDEHNHLQRWEFENGGELKPALDDDLCVVWRGTTANVGSDPMILLDCAHAKGRKNWSLA